MIQALAASEAMSVGEEGVWLAMCRCRSTATHVRECVAYSWPVLLGRHWHASMRHEPEHDRVALLTYEYGTSVEGHDGARYMGKPSGGRRAVCTQ